MPEPEDSFEKKITITPAHVQEIKNPKPGWFRSLFFIFTGHWFFLGALPLVIVLLESITGIFGEIVYDPISRPGQIALLTFVSAIGAFAAYTRAKQISHPWLPALWGLGLASALYWGFISSLVLLAGTVAYVSTVVMTIGIGLIASPIFLLCFTIGFAPCFTLISLLKNCRKQSSPLPLILGAFTGLLLLIIVEGPAYVTRHGIEHEDATLIRDWGSEKLLLDACHRGFLGTNDTTHVATGISFGLNQFFGGGRDHTRDWKKCRLLYYKVTGKAFNEGNPNDRFYSTRMRSLPQFDSGQGGDEVAGLVDKLSLKTSRLDGIVDGTSDLGYWEWTMEFSNQGDFAQEARMQLLLPEQGVVSRLTLWVNGTPQEAAFSSTEKVTRAYKAIVSRRRDPVLARWVGMDRVMVQCFPVPAEGEMKIRVGITAPLDVDRRLFLPRIIERNYSIPDKIMTSIWVDGDRELQMTGLSNMGTTKAKGTISARTLTSEHRYIQVHGPTSSEQLWTIDPFAPDEKKILTAQLTRQESSTPQSLIFVIDGSRFFQEWVEDFERSLNILREQGHTISVIYASEEQVLENPDRRPNFVGGQNCLPALIRALELAENSQADKLIWLHGTQPIDFFESEQFVQFMERSQQKTPFSVMDLAGGPNRLLELVGARFPIQSAGRPLLPKDLESTILRVANPSIRHYDWQTLPAGNAPEGDRVWDHLARWKIWQDVMKGALNKESRRTLSETAARYQLVTPVSGAVVLERASQYKRFGLTQADQNSTPSIPEPSTSLLVFFSLSLLWQRRRKTKL